MTQCTRKEFLSDLGFLTPVIKKLGGQEAIVINVPTLSYDYDHPDEHRVAPNDPAIPYEWKLKEG